MRRNITLCEEFLPGRGFYSRERQRGYLGTTTAQRVIFVESLVGEVAPFNPQAREDSSKWKALEQIISTASSLICRSTETQCGAAASGSPIFPETATVLG